jgi:high affinity sulfate transporter 1
VAQATVAEVESGRGWFLSSLRGYQRSWVGKDLVAGLTVWAVLVPEALAYASIAGVSPVIGLYAAPPALILYALFGSSKHLVTGPMAATAALSAAAIADVVTDPADAATFTAVLAIVTGLIALVAGLLRLGFIANFISEPVLKGFIVGLALTIIIGQVPKLFGIEGGEGNFFEKLFYWLGHLGETNATTLAVGLASLAIVLLIRRYLPVVPGPLAAVIFGIVAVAVLDLANRGVDIVGEIQAGLPAFGLPSTTPADYGALAPAAVGIMLVGFAEGLGAAKTYAAKHHYEIVPNQELIGLGMANLGAGLSSGMVVNGSLSKTAVNGTAGARSQVSGLVVAALTVLTLLFLTGLFADLPEATLAAVVIAAIVELVDVDALSDLYRSSSDQLGRIYGVAARADFIAAIAAMLGVLIFDTLPGLFIGITMSLVLMVYRSSRPHVAELGRVPGSDVFMDRERTTGVEITPGVEVLRVEAGLFFANADFVRTRVREAARREGTTRVVLDAETIPFVDVTAVKMLAELTEELEADGVALVIAKDIGQVRDLLPTGRPPVFATIEDAIAAGGSPPPQ